MVNPPATAGYLHSTWHGVRQGTPIGVAMGDMQCSVLAAQPSPTDAGTCIYIDLLQYDSG